MFKLPKEIILNLINAFDLDKSKPQIIAFVGGGGKSTTMYRLATELRDQNKKILVTSTTMIFHPEVMNRPFNYFFTGSINSFIENTSIDEGTITVAGKEPMADRKKIKGFTPEKLNFIQKLGIFDTILVEADGARGKPIKAPAEYEPVIPINTDIIAGIVGMDCIGSTINRQNVHRPELFTKITDSLIGDIIDIDIINKLLESSAGIFKNTSIKCRKIIIFNKSDTSYRITKARRIAENVLKSTGIERILITSMTGNNPVIAVKGVY